VKDMRAARECKGDRALLEGPHLVREAAASGLDFDILVATDDFLVTGEARRLCQELDRSPLRIAPELLDALLDSDSPRGVAAVVTLPMQPLAAIEKRFRLAVYADEIQDPGNLGAIARSAEAVGADALLLGPGCAKPNHPRAMRASAGSLLRVPRILADASSWRTSPIGHATWIGLDGQAKLSIYDLDTPKATVLAVGSEGRGLSPQLRERLDQIVSIPLEAPVESLNAAVATGIALFELRRPRP